MTDQLRSIVGHPNDEPQPRGGHPWRVFGITVAAVVGALIVVAIIGVLAGVNRPASRRPPPPTVRAVQRASAARLVAIKALLQQRSTAIVDHDEDAFMATVDPAETSFWRSQNRMFANLARVTFASWSYTVAPTSARPDPARARRYDARIWAPASVELHYRIAGFDTTATDLVQYPTFVERGVHWYLGSLSDFRSRSEISATGLWDYAPVTVVRRRSVLVLGAAGEAATMSAVADAAQAAIPKVTAVWGSSWPQRVVVLVPSSEREMTAITGDRGDLHQISALTTAEVSRTAGRPGPVGDRVTINPVIWPTLDQLGAAVVLAHELTHVATATDTGVQTPKWLSEGFADYVGFRDTGLPATSVAQELTTQVRAGQVPQRLPTNADFNGSSSQLPQAYQASWLACRYIAARYGQRRLIRFYKSVGTSARSTTHAVSTALRQVLGLTVAQLTTRWRGYVKAQLA